MSTLQSNGINLYYEDTTEGDETIVFSHGLLWNTHLFDEQVKAFREQYRCVAYDHRGQGRSDVPKESAIGMETVYQDAVHIIESLKAAPCHFVGVSMGGFTGLRIALRRPELLRSLTLIGSSADPEPRENQFRNRLLNTIARFTGMRLVVDKVMNMYFGKDFLTDPARAELRKQWREHLSSNKRSVHRAVNGVIQRDGVSEQISQISVPTLILVGEEDATTVPEKSQRMQQAIRGSSLVIIPKAGHTITVEAPEQTNAALREFFEGGAGVATGNKSRR